MTTSEVMFIGTGVFATVDEVAIVKRYMQDANNAPLIIALGRVDVPYEMRELAMDYIDMLAVKHGLPAPGKDADGDTNHYGMLGSGEFMALAELGEAIKMHRSSTYGKEKKP